MPNKGMTYHSPKNSNIRHLKVQYLNFGTYVKVAESKKGFLLNKQYTKLLSSTFHYKVKNLANFNFFFEVGEK